MGKALALKMGLTAALESLTCHRLIVPIMICVCSVGHSKLCDLMPKKNVSVQCPVTADHKGNIFPNLEG